MSLRLNANTRNAVAVPLTLVLLLAFTEILPLLLHAAPSCGHDFGFHMQSWLAVEHAWKAGIPVPHWVAPANWGAGEARFQFYPPLSWLLGAALGAVLPWSWVPAAFTAVCLGGAAAAMYGVARSFRPPAQAAVAAAVYAASPYLLFAAYERTAYSELLAAVWMPLLLGTLLRRPLRLTQTGMLLAALWYTNAPAGVMGFYLLAFSALWGLKSGHGARFTTLFRHAAAGVLGGLLAADYLLPAWYEQRFVEIDRAVSPGLRIGDSFLFGHMGETFHDGVLRTASWIAVCTVGAGLLAAGAGWLRRRAADGNGRPHQISPQQVERLSIAFLASLLAICFLLQLRPSGLAWRTLPELRFLQFPWRLLLPASAATGLLFGLALSPGILEKVPARSWIVAGLLFAVGLTTWAGLTRFQPCDEEDTVAAHLLWAGGDAGFAGTDEYAAAGSDNGEIQQGLPRVRLLRAPAADEGDDAVDANPAWKPFSGTPGKVEVLRWGPDGFTLRLRPEAEAYAVLRWERFPGWELRVDGSPCGVRCVLREDGLLTIELPPKQWSTVTAEWRVGADAWWGRALSTFGFLSLLLRFLPGRFRHPVMMGRK